MLSGWPMTKPCAIDGCERRATRRGWCGNALHAVAGARRPAHLAPTQKVGRAVPDRGLPTASLSKGLVRYAL